MLDKESTKNKIACKACGPGFKMSLNVHHSYTYFVQRHPHTCSNHNIGVLLILAYRSTLTQWLLCVLIDSKCTNNITSLLAWNMSTQSFDIYNLSNLLSWYPLRCFSSLFMVMFLTSWGFFLGAAVLTRLCSLHTDGLQIFKLAKLSRSKTAW